MPERIGVIAKLTKGLEVFDIVAGYGLETCQVNCWEESLFTDANAKELRKASDERGMRITSLWAGWPGPKVWDLVEGPTTLGIVPEQYRPARVAALEKAGEFAQAAELPAIVTHLGFIPENAADPQFAAVVDTVGGLAESYLRRGIEFWFETGQETPVTMLRLIESIGLDNLGLNLDPANLILYGKANPCDSLDVFGGYVRSVHAKDAFYPTDPMKLGNEVRVGEGAVDFPRFVEKLEGLGFDGAYIIEREIEGDEQAADIRRTITYLDDLLSDMERS
jgi:sugar phosphate isomerase/epimerase